MKVLFLTLLLAHLYYAKAGKPDKYCVIEGLDKYNWKDGYFTMKEPINSSYIGPIAKLQTKYIQNITDQKSTYLTARFEQDTLTISTNDNFKNYSFEVHANPITIYLKFKCSERAKYNEIEIRQKVLNPNYKGPTLNQEAYEYNFAMPIPKNYELTKFTNIFANDDGSGSVYFSLDFNEQFSSQYNGKGREGMYYTSLKSLKEIRAPFQQSYTLHVRDRNGMNSTAPVKIVVFTDGNDIPGESPEPPTSHPPVFEKHVYFANYTTVDLKMDNNIAIKYGGTPQTTVNQSDYQDYLRITLDESNTKNLKVTVIKPLPDNIIKTSKLIVIEIKAFNKGIDIPGKTALVIRTYTGYDTNQTNSYATTCIANYSHTPIILLSISLFSIILVNLFVFGWYVRKNMVKNINVNM